MEGSSPRFERRAWAAAFLDLPDPSAVAASEETYLLWQGRPDFNLKLRGGRLELKELIAEKNGLQQWRPGPKLGFPLAGQELCQLGLASPGRSVTYEDLAALLPDLEQAGLLAVPLRKRRLLFERSGCRAETAIVEARGKRLATAAVEDMDAALVRRAAAEMGLDRWPNLSYPTTLLPWSVASDAG